jgi:hypothetical protein
MVFTPDLGDAATASCPWERRMVTTFEPMSPVPPITTTFMGLPFLVFNQRVQGCSFDWQER